MSWVVPTLDEQWAHLREIGALLKANTPTPRVRFLTSNFEWLVEGYSTLGEDGQAISVRLVSPKSERTRTAWPWELRAVG